MKPTFPRLVIAGDRSLRVQGDFGGGYTEYFGDDPEKRRRAIVRALIYMPGAKLIDSETDCIAELAALAATRLEGGAK